MIPPFSTVDHRIGSSSLPYEERRVLRRSAPEALRFDVPSPGSPIAQPAALPSPASPREAPRGRFAKFLAMARLWAPA